MSNWPQFTVELAEHKAPEAIIYRLSGVLTNSRESYEFLENLQHRMRAKPGLAVLNLERLERITSAGVGIIAACYTSSMNAHGRLVLVSIPKQVETVLNVVCLLKVIEHHRTEEEALR